MRLVQAYSEELLNKIYDLYMEAFPKEERKPFTRICIMQQEGRMTMYAIEDDAGAFVGMGIFVLYQDLALLDYFAIEAGKRGQGLGSEALGLLQRLYPDKRFFLEIESTYEAFGEECPEKSLRGRRKQFYLRNGMQPLSFLIKLFGVEMELLAYGCSLSFEEYYEMYQSIVTPNLMKNIVYWGEVKEYGENRTSVCRQECGHMRKGCHMKNYKLSNGVEIPAIGFGTYLATEGNGKQGILNALEAGYRYLDTASFYKNEEEIGEAIAESGIARTDLFIASKVWRTEMGYENTKEAFAASLKRLQTDYLDLYLIHWPKASKDVQDWKQMIQETWRAMEELYQAGKVRAIGLSNFLPHHIEALLETARVMPTVNQLELHVGYMQTEAVNYCKAHNILVQAWSPLGRKRLFEEPVIQEMAAKYQVTIAQLLLGFLDQEDIAVIPKASTVDRCRENMNIWGFTLSREDNYFLKCLPQMGWSGEHPDL